MRTYCKKEKAIGYRTARRVRSQFTIIVNNFRSEENRAARFAKKREATVKREQDRRFRMNLYLDKLKELIPVRLQLFP